MISCNFRKLAIKLVCSNGIDLYSTASNLQDIDSELKKIKELFKEIGQELDVTNSTSLTNALEYFNSEVKSLKNSADTYDYNSYKKHLNNLKKITMRQLFPAIQRLDQKSSSLLTNIGDLKKEINEKSIKKDEPPFTDKNPTRSIKVNDYDIPEQSLINKPFNSFKFYNFVSDIVVHPSFLYRFASQISSGVLKHGFEINLENASKQDLLKKEIQNAISTGSVRFSESDGKDKKISIMGNIDLSKIDPDVKISMKPIFKCRAIFKNDGSFVKFHVYGTEGSIAIRKL